jgi:uncharacterized delta-60 repeat protein
MALIQIGFWAASGAGALSYWISTLGGADYETGHSVANDSVGNAYVLGETNAAGAGGNEFLLAKYDTLGAVQWQRTLGGTGNETGYSVTSDSSDNVYVLGLTNSTGAGSYDFLFAKYNSAGTLQWQRILGSSQYDTGYSIATDSSDNVYLLGREGGYPYDFLLAKYNSAGTIQWQRTLGGAGSDQGYSVAVDSSDSLYVLGQSDSSGAGATDFLLAKYDSAGTIQWQRNLGGASNEIGNSVATDASNNAYVIGETYSTGAGEYDSLLAKYNSSGTLQWQRTLGGLSSDYGKSVAVDSLGNAYAFGYSGSTGAGGDDFLIAKYNSAGTIQWQRTLGATSLDRGHSISIDLSDTLYVLGYTASTGGGNDDFLLAKLPNDGSLTGTYVLDGVSMVYAASSLTDSSASLTSATSSLTSATSSLTAATSSLTSASASLTSYLVEL